MHVSMRILIEVVGKPGHGAIPMSLVRVITQSVEGINFMCNYFKMFSRKDSNKQGFGDLVPNYISSALTSMHASSYRNSYIWNVVVNGYLKCIINR